MAARIVALIAAGAIVGCGGDDGSGSGADSDERAERCAAINEWSFQEGNAISEHPQYDWWQRNCE